jgi:hypothetical protein
MLCYLRYPGRPLQAGEIPDPALVSFVATQIDVLPDSLGAYLKVDQNRRRIGRLCRIASGRMPKGIEVFGYSSYTYAMFRAAVEPQASLSHLPRA